MKPVTSMSLVRIGLGALSIARPNIAAKAMKLDGPGNPQMSYMTRMFGSREVALGLVTLLSQGKARRKLLTLGIAVDSSDAFAGFDAGRSGAVSQSTSAALTAPAVLAVVTGVLGLVGRPKKVKKPDVSAVEA